MFRKHVFQCIHVCHTHSAQYQHCGTCETALVCAAVSQTCGVRLRGLEKFFSPSFLRWPTLRWQYAESLAAFFSLRTSSSARTSRFLLCAHSTRKYSLRVRGSGVRRDGFWVYLISDLSWRRSTSHVRGNPGSFVPQRAATHYGIRDGATHNSHVEVCAFPHHTQSSLHLSREFGCSCACRTFDEDPHGEHFQTSFRFVLFAISPTEQGCSSTSRLFLLFCCLTVNALCRSEFDMWVLRNGDLHHCVPRSVKAFFEMALVASVTPQHHRRHAIHVAHHTGCG